MSKILVHLEVPAIEKNYDILVPDDLEVQTLTPMLTEAIESLTNRHYVSSGQNMLCLREPDTLLLQNRTLSNYKVKNCDHLVLL